MSDEKPEWDKTDPINQWLEANKPDGFGDPERVDELVKTPTPTPNP